MKKVLLVGAGGWARQCWIDEVLPTFKDRIEVVGLIDRDESILKDSGTILDLSKAELFTDIDTAFSTVKADFCIISIPPAYHKDAVFAAISKGLPILSEKPVADTFADVREIYRVVTENSIKMAITQNYRFESPILTMKKVLESGELGAMDYLIARYASDYRTPGSWGVDHVHDRDIPLLIEGAIHQFDMIRNLTGSDCKTISGLSWNPDWSSFKGDCSALFIMEMKNGVKAVYEGNSLAAGEINNWFHEYYRVECERGAVAVGSDQVVRVYRRTEDEETSVEEVQSVVLPQAGHLAILDDFLGWLNGGDACPTRLEDNVKSSAMIFAARDAARKNEVIQVDDYLL